jgi:restriction endonuclease S subunit
MPRGDKGAIMRYEVPDKNEAQQRRIVALLQPIQNQIELNARTNGYLEELLDAKFAEMQAEADDTWKDASLLDIANYKNGLAMQKFRPQPGDKGLPVLKIRELGQGECGPDAERCSSDIEDSVHVRDGDLIFSWSGTLMLDFWAGGDAGLNQHLFKMTSDKYPSWFYYMWTKHHMRKFIAMAKDRATTMGHIKRSALANAAVKIPPSDVLRSQTKAMQLLVDEVVGLKIQSRKLANLRDALLPKLMSGEIDVSKVEVPTPLNSHLCER